MDSAEALDLLKIKSRLLSGRLEDEGDLQVFDCIESTNDWCLSQCQNLNAGAKACLAEQQLHGRGRNGRDWYSPRAQNIYMSLGYQFNLQPSQLYGMSMMAGVCMAHVLNNAGISCGLKWPNDVYVGLAKLAGILVETRIRSATDICAVIGVGLNYDMGDQCQGDIDKPWTDVQKEMQGKPVVDRSLLAGDILNEILSGCDMFAKDGFDAFRHEWDKYDVCKGKELDIFTGDGVEQGQYVGINDEGALIARINNDQRVFYAADVSIRVKK